jgi:hypothetical protein
MHVEYHDKWSLASVEKYMAAHRWDGYLNLGDFLDFNEISKYVIGRPGSVKERISKTFATGREILTRHRKILGKKCRMVLIEGNHDYRATDYALRHPEMEGLIEVPLNLHLKQLEIEWVPFWSKGKLFRLGNACFHHGRFTGLYHAKKHVEYYGVCNYYGHSHDIMFYPKVTHGNDKTLEAGSLGCLCRYDQQYMKGAPTNWQQAVSTLFLQPNGNYNLYISRIFRHRFVGPDGKMYDARAAAR